jgi:hypothetical protein
MYFETNCVISKCCMLYKIIVTYIKTFASCRNECFFNTRKIKSGQSGKFPDSWRDVIAPDIVTIVTAVVGSQ